jgi:ATP-dependent protease Clp ATPase subunit
MDLRGAFMRFQPAQQLSCTFCEKSQRDAKKLIASPDKHTYICDQCTLEPNRLKPTSEKSGSQRIATSPSSSRVSRFFRSVWRLPSRNAFRCSFCRKKQRSLDLYASPVEREIQARICADCLAVCRQILADEAKADSIAAARPKS